MHSDERHHLHHTPLTATPQQELNQLLPIHTPLPAPTTLLHVHLQLVVHARLPPLRLLGRVLSGVYALEAGERVE